MIKINRIVLASNLVFDDCKLYNLQEQNDMDIINVFKDDQLFFEDSLGNKNIIPNYAVTSIELQNNIARKALSLKKATKVLRLSLSGDITHSPAWIIPQQYYKEFNVPMIFEELSQLTFFNKDKKLYIISDVNISLIQYQ